MFNVFGVPRKTKQHIWAIAPVFQSVGEEERRPGVGLLVSFSQSRHVSRCVAERDEETPIVVLSVCLSSRPHRTPSHGSNEFSFCQLAHTAILEGFEARLQAYQHMHSRSFCLVERGPGGGDEEPPLNTLGSNLSSRSGQEPCSTLFQSFSRPRDRKNGSTKRLQAEQHIHPSKSSFYPPRGVPLQQTRTFLCLL
jgi:hypothetical protein